MTQRVAWCLFSTTLGTGSTLAWPPSRPGGRAGRCGRLDTWAWALALGHLVLDFYYTLECLGFLLYLGYLDMDTCTCTWVSIIFLDVSAFERGMKGPVNFALWLSGAQLFVSHSVFMGACFWLQSQSTLLFWFHSLDSWSTIMSLGTSSLLQGCQSMLRGMGARKIKKQ